MPFGPATRRTDLLNEQGPHIFFSPHADDVVLSCGGTIHSLVSQNKPVEVIGVFGGKTDSRYSAYARHLHAKWRLRGNPIDARWREDAAAMNQLGLTTVELLRREGAHLHVRGIDMLDGTPILDIKPYLSSIPPENLRRGWLAEAEARQK